MKLSRITDKVTALILAISLQTLATLPSVTALSMGSLPAETHTVAAVISTPKYWQQCALQKGRKIKYYLACVPGMSVPGQNRAKVRNSSAILGSRLR